MEGYRQLPREGVQKYKKISVLTGANSGGKTTLLEMILQSQVLTSMGFPVNADNTSTVKFYDEIIYLKKFTGTQGSGAFEQTIRNLVEILDSKTSKFLLIDEFEAVTEPGAAAKILINFLLELNKKDIVDLDEERKAAMVSNLMVILCGDKDASPVLNTGTLNH